MTESLTEVFKRLDDQAQWHVQLHLCQHALTIWEGYAQQHAPIAYVDSVVGMHHIVDLVLPHDALISAQSGRDLDDVAFRYREPIVAMQDDDLIFPEYITFAYYAIYNLFRKYAQGEPIDAWLIVNQALSAHENPARWRDVLISVLP